VLSAFIVICTSVMILRRRKPELHRAFRTPWVPLVPLVGVAFSIWLLAELPAITWKVFLVWVSLGLLIYLGYGMRHSKLERDRR
jgi:APA family basic amino acid/polyamine antiporter